ncbi:hypothetical protein ACZ90_03675 [Streptomyces albus subsp. albus]|nr:hypothetical protein ACZ90_03675 [Streptomyces albus subsp. albus]
MRLRAAALAAALLCLPLTACGSDGDDDSLTTKPKATGSGSHAAPGPGGRTAEESPSASAPATAQVAKVGDTITLKGQQRGEQLDVTVKKWLDPAKGADEFNTPGKGKRYVAAQIQLTNTGTTLYSDSPTNCVQIADSDGQRFESTYADIAAGPQMASDLKLPTGDKALGWVVVEVPKASKVATLQFALDSGFADQTGQWEIG